MKSIEKAIKTCDANMPNWNYLFRDIDNVMRHLKEAKSNALKDYGSINRDAKTFLDNKDVPDDIKRLIREELNRLYKEINR